MSPRGLSNPGDIVTNSEEGLIRRAWRSGQQKYIVDQITGKIRLPVAVFEPRLPANRPDAKRTDKYLSVNILSSLESAGLPPDWNGNDTKIYSARLNAGACHELDLSVTWEPVLGLPNPSDDNPHHGGIHGVVELYYANNDAYEVTITKLAKASEVLPECLFRSPPPTKIT